jgi:hypothetical protein
MTKLTLLLFVCFLVTLGHAQDICILWKNSFVKIEKSQNFSTLTVKSRQDKGWLGVRFSSAKISFETSFSVIGIFKSNILQFKNHTESDKNLNFFDSSIPNTVNDFFDRIFTFSFKMNNTEFDTKKYLQFAISESDFTYSQNNSILPRHDSISDPIYFELNSTEKYPPCSEELNIPGRALAYHWASYWSGVVVYISIGLLFIIFKNDQPLKSRFIAPLISLFALTLNLFGEYLYGIISYESSTKFFCLITAFLNYTVIQVGFTIPTLMIIRYSILLQFYIQKQNFIKKWKQFKKSGNDSSTDVTKAPKKKGITLIIVKCARLFKRIFKLLSSHYIFLIIPVFWGIFFDTVLVVMFAIYGFKCSSEIQTYIRFFHFGCLIIQAGIIAILIVFDFILSLKNLVCCRWKNYFFIEDPYHYRIDMIVIFLIIPLLVLWVFIPIPYLFKSITVDLICILGLAISGGNALIISIVKKLIFFLRKKRSKTTSISIEEILKDENLLDKFIAFCESEWSTENIYFKLDIVDYKSSREQQKQKYAMKIKENYLISRISPLEVNLSSGALARTLGAIEKGNFDEKLFELAEQEVEVNLFDTVSRFIVSSEFNKHLKRRQSVSKDLGLSFRNVKK